MGEREKNMSLEPDHTPYQPYEPHKLPYVQRTVTDGRPYFYVRVGRLRVALDGDPNLREHAAQYRSALLELTGKSPAHMPKMASRGFLWSFHPDQDHLYVIESDAGMLKIGRSKDPVKRCLTLQQSNPHTLRLVKYFERRGGEERQIHEALKQFRKRGEWFEATPDALIAVQELLGPMAFATQSAAPAA